MSRRKGEVTGHMNEREFPHLVELELPPGGFRSQNLEFDAFHREQAFLFTVAAAGMRRVQVMEVAVNGPGRRPKRSG